MLEQPENNMNNIENSNFTSETSATPQSKSEIEPLKKTRTYSIVLDFFVSTVKVDMSFN